MGNGLKCFGFVVVICLMAKVQLLHVSGDRCRQRIQCHVMRGFSALREARFVTFHLQVL